MQRHDLAEALARVIHLAALDEAADLDREPRVLGERRGRNRPPRARRTVGPVSGDRFSCDDGSRSGLDTHTGIRWVRDSVYSLSHRRELLTVRIAEGTFPRFRGVLLAVIL